MIRPSAVIAAAALLLSCDSGSAPSNLGAGSLLTLINGATQAGTVKLYVDDAFVGNVSVAQTTGGVDLSPGHHKLEVRRTSGAAGFVSQVDLAAGAGLVLVALDSAGLLRSAVLDDSNTVVPAGATKLRVAHFAQAAGSIDIWRTQPDFGTPIRIMFPFDYHDISPYVQSTPGDWEVLVSTAISNPTGPMPDTLGVTGPIAIADGESRTVLVVDDPAGGVRLIVVDP